MACKEEPPLSFNPLIALVTISDVGGWVGFDLGFLAFEDFSFFNEEADVLPAPALG